MEEEQGCEVNLGLTVESTFQNNNLFGPAGIVQVLVIQGVDSSSSNIHINWQVPQSGCFA